MQSGFGHPGFHIVTSSGNFQSSEDLSSAGTASRILQFDGQVRKRGNALLQATHKKCWYS